ncbi:Uncharacterised protein [Mycobacteroides abscessus subsp. abscessus]|nr:Uncharacterised protein [Mycobacteroides abscessus subsp. abscessus]
MPMMATATNVLPSPSNWTNRKHRNFCGNRGTLSAHLPSSSPSKMLYLPCHPVEFALYAHDWQHEGCFTMTLPLPSKANQ